MIRMALIGCPDDVYCYRRVASRLRGGRFTAVVDRETQTARGTALALDIDTWSDSLDTLLAEQATAFDAVILHCPSQFHDSLCQRAATAGKHVLVDSPLALSATAATDVIAACASAGVRLMVGQEFRFLPSLQEIKASLDSGQLGEPGLLRIHRWEPPGPPTEVLPLTREIDLACWLFRQSPATVYAVGRRLSRREPEEPDYVQLHLGFSGGGMALIDHAQTVPPGDGYYSLSLIGSTGAAYADDHHNMQLLFGRGHPAALRTGQGDVAVLAQLQEFLQAINENREPAVSGADGRRALEVAEAAARSIERSQSLSRAGDAYVLVD
jgi:predicted dehydrogenase